MYAAVSSGLIFLDESGVTLVSPASSLLDQPCTLSIPSVLPLHPVSHDNLNEHASGACEARHEPRSDVMSVDDAGALPPASTHSPALTLITRDVEGEHCLWVHACFVCLPVRGCVCARVRVHVRVPVRIRVHATHVCMLVHV